MNIIINTNTFDLKGTKKEINDFIDFYQINRGDTEDLGHCVHVYFLDYYKYIPPVRKAIEDQQKQLPLFKE